MSDKPPREAAEAFHGEAEESPAQAPANRRIARTAPESAMLARLAHLQRTAGNAAVVQLLTPPATG
ncbi:hypothetical protein O1Q96_26355 [Streptomyces sp. Qhu-G9]|uniref:hypothetical protein n=1 Tax=Streptomyces sp. Qhu-G9 TaxID=3452799 RepID=UPI0022AC553E|nr:hypothetical protein [Streptomyces aurantiacus]WAU82900.1 hypothetical protein O1Q96_26355 [Streptomyces aurantiacus]